MGGGVGLRGGGQGGCDRRIEVFGKIQKKKLGSWGGDSGGGVGLRGVRVVVIEELNFLGKFKKKNWGLGGGGGGGVGLVGGGGGSGWM